VVERIGLLHTPWIGALVVSVALGLTMLSGGLDRRDARRGDAVATAPLAY
jgi:MFS transporter, DHA1 family, inner membrane transport protein